MKKLLCIFLSVLALFGLCSCGIGNLETGNRFINLQDDQTLRVGANGIYMNYENQNITPSYLTYTVRETYTLVRSYYDYAGGNNSIQYNGYYYHWEKETVTDEELLGEKTVKTTTAYSYLPYTNAENIAVKTTIETETTFDYECGFITRPFERVILLGNYFSSIEDLKEKCPDLYNLLPSGKTEKEYYLDTTVAISVQSSIQTYTSTYYYFE